MYNTSMLFLYLHTLLDAKHSKWHILGTFWSSGYTLLAGTGDPCIETIILTITNNNPNGLSDSGSYSC